MNLIALSANEDPLYIDFWPIVAWANRHVLGVEPTLAFLTDRREDDDYVTELRRHGTVKLYRRISGIPDCNAAKMIRSILCAESPAGTVGYIQDIDLLPLNREWVMQKVAQRPTGKLLLVGAEVYQAFTPEQKRTSSAPASMMTAEAEVWRQLLNPAGLSYVPLFRSWEDMPHRANEEIGSLVYHESEHGFSDEKFMRTLRLKHGVDAHHVERGYDLHADTLDRSAWRFDPERLAAGQYLESHLPRPLHEHEDKILPLVEWISKRFAGGSFPRTPEKRLGFAHDRYQFDGTGINRPMWDRIRSLVKRGGFVLEYGSGPISTRYLAELYAVHSVEEAREFLGRENTQYVHAPVVDSWYSLPDSIKDRSFDLILVDGPHNRACWKHLAERGCLQAPTILINRTDDLSVDCGRRVAERLGRPLQVKEGYLEV